MADTVEATADGRPPGPTSARGSDGGPGGPWRDGWPVDAAIVVALASLFVVLFVLLRQQPFHYDPIEYFRTAQNFEKVAPFHRSLRIGLHAPVRLVQAIFGYSQAGFYTVPLASGVLLLGSTYVLGRTVANRAVGAAAAVLVVLTPPVFSTVHQLWPDVPGTAVFTAALALTTVLCKRHRDVGGGGAWLHVAFLVAGALVGWSYLIREFTVVLFPVVLLPFWAYRTPWRYLLPGAVGALVAFGGELAFNARYHDDAFVRIRDLLGKTGEGGGPPAPHLVDLYEARSAERGGLLQRLSVFPSQLVAGRIPLLAAVGAAAVASPFVTRGDRRRANVMLVVWVLFYWAFVMVLALDVDEYGRALYIEKTRYWFPVFPPLVIAGCAAVGAVVARLPRVRVRAVVASALALLLVVGVGADIAPRIGALGEGEQHPYEQLRRWLVAEGGGYDSVATTQRTWWIFEVYANGPFGGTVWDGRVRAMNTARRFVGPDQVDTDLVLVDDTFFEARRSNWREVTPEWLLDLPDDWRPVAATDDGQLVVYERGAEPLSFRPVTTRWTSQSSELEGAPRDGFELELVRGDRTNVGLRVAPDVGTGGVVLTEFDVTTAGDGNVVPYCFMVGADGERVRRDASTLWGVGFEGPKRVQAACTVPVDLAPPVDVRIGLTLVGPLDVEVGPAERAVVTTSTAWRRPD